MTQTRRPNPAGEPDSAPASAPARRPDIRPAATGTGARGTRAGTGAAPPSRRDLASAALAAALAAPALLRAPAARAAAEEAVRLRDLYEKDLSFSAYARAREGRQVAVEGFMAPPLRAESTFFVLTNRPLAVCPFCESEAQWPDDILAVLTRRIFEVQPFNVKLSVTGRLELGTETDPDTGFVSRVRLADADFARA